MALSFRQNEILDIARTEGRVVVEDLAQRFDVTLQTIRRDLTELADTGYLDRVHGGAVPRTGGLRKASAPEGASAWAGGRRLSFLRSVIFGSCLSVSGRAGKARQVRAG